MFIKHTKLYATDAQEKINFAYDEGKIDSTFVAKTENTVDVSLSTFKPFFCICFCLLIALHLQFIVN